MIRHQRSIFPLFLSYTHPRWHLSHLADFHLHATSSFFAAHESDNSGSNDANSRGRCNVCGTAIVCITASRRAYRNNRFEQVNFGLSLAQLVNGLTDVVAVLSLFNGDHPNGRVGEFIGCCEMRNAVMLVVRQLHVIFDPNDGRQRICFDVTFQIHVVLQGLTQSRSWHCDHWSEFNFQINIPTIAFADTIVGNAIICATIFFAYGVDL